MIDDLFRILNMQKYKFYFYFQIYTLIFFV